MKPPKADGTILRRMSLEAWPYWAHILGIFLLSLLSTPLALLTPLPLKILLGTGSAGYIVSHACKTLARAGYTPVVERSAQAPVNPYGESKLFLERALGWYARCHGFAWMALRYFNSAGADARVKGVWIGEHVKDFIWVMVYTDLRTSNCFIEGAL